jgi:hypothetical protein
MIAPIIAIIAVIALVGFLAYQGDSNSLISAGSSAFDVITKGTPAQGFTITHVNPENPQQSSTSQDSILQTTENSQTNSTQIISENNVNAQDDILTYSISNIPPIQGYIKLYDADQNPIKPYSYDYRITISCSSLGSYCNLDPSPSNRGITTNGGTDENGNELGGYYNWNWSLFQTQSNILPSNVDEVLLDVSLFIDVNKPDGSWVTEESSYLMRIIP